MPITGQNSTAIAEYSDNAVYTAPIGTPIPAGPFPTAFAAGWTILGHLASDGITGSRDVQNQKEYSSTGDLVYESWSQLDEAYTVICDESNPVVENLKNPNAVQTVATPGVQEVQTATVNGSPTGGTFTLSYNGSTTAPIAYNAAASAVQSALRALPGLSLVTVSGTGPYTITFPASYGNVPQVTADGSALTGGTSPSVVTATTTPGVTPVYQWVKSSSGILSPQLRLFAVDAVKVGSPGWAERSIFTGRAAATDIGVIGKGNIRKTTFRIGKYVDSVLGVETVLSTNPAHAANVFA